MQQILGGIARAIIALMAGTVAGSDADLGSALKAFIDGLLAGDANQIGSTLITLAVIVWSIYAKRKEIHDKEAK